MKRSPELADALFRNRQRQELTRVKSALPWFGGADLELATATSELDEQVRSELAERRPAQAGHLVVTEDIGRYATAVAEFFDAQREERFILFMANHEDLGGVLLTGAVLAKRAVEMLLFDGDGLYGCDEPQREVVSLDRTVNDDGATVFEFFHFMRET